MHIAITSLPPIILSLAEGARPYYTFSQKMFYQTVTDLLWPDFYLSMNLVFTVNEGCELILTQDYSSYQRFLDMWQYCGSTASYSDEWNGGMMLNDTCSQFYMTAGFELKGYLWDFPLTDMRMAVSTLFS